ncbi:DUF559 domain-containing protein [Accumulibacter sp.]|uniref:DUF559 domain-containing protein n=1 Tax=Accumulibacter sp. TaxID=2053492 RepID=UPI0025F75065|nr:DUF559 domain-containing protein [Accumulibacter sp.]MCM8614225.1 DUF559 domain-containing protein [Accumulibacter sp.]MCM8638006.1 DUF559 domain-containing protein [Accumulibacter sp.]MCM8641350.1 DUF559 domain-containing protein [Accumulibacter sp.]
MKQTLSRGHRKILEATVAQARATAEAGAEKALKALAVGAKEAPGHASDAQKKLRVRLRAHGRALGDLLHPDDTQAIDHLVTEIAYEHWHRMLFARFLAESDLLMHPDGYPVSLADCKEDAESFDPPARSEWEVAGRYAARMLPNVFRPDSPALAIQMPLETEQALEALLAKLPATVFQADDSLGWSYQFWQAPKKEEVQRQMKQAGTKVGADELPAVTQLFTEQYMVAFLLENALGGWWHRCHPHMALPVEMPYLRFLPSPSGRGAGGEGVSMPKHHDIPSEHIAFARQLRATQTDAEDLIWSLLRNRRLADAKFRRQHPLGPYVVDFYCHEKRLAIELDGGQHSEEAAKAHDARRDDYLAGHGIRVLRFWNNQVLAETESVQEVIWQALHDDCALTPTPLPKGEGLYGAVPPAATSLPHIGRESGGKHAVLPSPPGRGAGGEGEPVAGTFPAWPDTLSQFKLLDPCAGSGHFLVSAFHYLVPLRRATEQLSVRDAVDRVLADNLHGLELDARCVEIAAFALALAAWRYPDLDSPLPPGEGPGVRAKPIGYRPLPRLNIACVGVAPRSRRADWLKLAGGDERLEGGMAALYALFQKAPELGSLIDPMAATRGDLLDAHWQELESRLEQALLPSPSGRGAGGEGAGDDQDIEARVAAQGMVHASRILTRKYHLVITNPPYLGAGQHGPVLKDFCEEHYKAAKGDLANVFLERSLKLCAPGSAVSFVMPQNWLFLKSYQKQREHLLKFATWNLLARLGAGAFETIIGEVVNAVLLTLTHARPAEDHPLGGVDASAPKTPEDKATLLREGEVVTVGQMGQLRNPDARITFEAAMDLALLAQAAEGVHGFGSKDSPRFFRQFWELNGFETDWQLMQTTVEKTGLWGGYEQAVYWQQGKGILAEMGKAGLAIPAGKSAWGKLGVAVSQMRNLPCALHLGEIFDKNVAVVLPNDSKHLPAIWCFCSSSKYNEAVRKIDQKVNVTNTTLVKVPFDLTYWQLVAAERYPHGLPKPYSDDPTQWIFHGHPKPASDPLQVAIARLLGYRWPAESALTPGPSPARGRGEQYMELSDEARAWIKRCGELDALTDDDGIVCLPAVRGEAAAESRLRALLAKAFGSDWSAARESQLLRDAGCDGLPLAQWLRDKFFEEHVARFQKRPFIWHVWDGHKEGFAALVNYHLLTREKLNTLINLYLGDWITQQKRAVDAGNSDATLKLAKAEALKAQLEAILAGEPPYDIFVRWKPLHLQPLGWDLDLNDGVRMNIRPFVEAGVLRIPRAKLGIKWDADRGKDVASAPWFKLGPTYNQPEGTRINDHHTTLAEKKEAREKLKVKA